MKPEAILINVGRGRVVDEEALYNALKENRIAGAGLDVFHDEPQEGPPNESIVALAKLPNVVATPHMAYNTAESSERLGQELLKNLKSCLKGAPINVVN